MPGVGLPELPEAPEAETPEEVLRRMADEVQGEGNHVLAEDLNILALREQRRAGRADEDETEVDPDG